MGSHLYFLVTICALLICKCIAAENEGNVRLRRQTSTIKITTIEEEPYLMVVNENATGNARFEGYMVDLLQKIAYQLGVDYELELVPDGKYGSLTAQGDWSGMVGQLINGEADMAAAPLIISYLRMKHVDFSQPFMQSGLSVLMKKPTSPRERADLFAILYPFSYEVWFLIIVAFVVVGFMHYVLSRFSPYEWRALAERNEVTSTEGQYFNCMNSFWFVFSTLTLQGYHNSPRSIATRLLSVVWFFFTIVILFAYFSNLGVALTTERIRMSPIQGFDDLSRQTEVQYGAFANGSTASFFRHSKIEVFKKMGSFMDSNPTLFVSSMKEGIDKVLESDGRYAFISDTPSLQFTVASAKDCRLYLMPGEAAPRSYAFAFPQDVALRRDVDQTLLILKENGQLDALKAKWWKDGCEQDKESRAKSTPESRTGPRVLSLNTLGGLFILLLVGVIVSIVAVICEIAVYKLKSKDNAKKTETEGTGAMV